VATEIIACINASYLERNVATISAFDPVAGDLARMVISAESQGEYTEDGKDAPAGESGIKRRKHTKDKLIRLDDLLLNRT
jgi:hypothetical protein